MIKNKCNHGKNWSQCFQQAITSKNFAPECLANIVEEMHGWFIYRVNNRVDAEDLAQELYIALLQYFHNFDVEKAGNGKSYVFAMARNICVQYIRKKENHNPLVEQVDKSNSKPETTEMQEAVQHCISKLETRLRVVVVHRDIEGRPAEEVAQITNIPKRTQHLYRQKAYTNLKKCLELQGVKKTY